jgi:hypothetical protein
MFTALSKDPEEDSNISTLVIASPERHRFKISVASVESGLRSFGIVQRERSGNGFEDTLRDFLIVQILAGSSKVTITDSPTDVLSPLKELLRSRSKNVSLTVTIVLRAQALTVGDALEACKVAVVKEAWSRLSSVKVKRTIGVAVVIKNGEVAPAADVFAFIGQMNVPACETGISVEQLSVATLFPNDGRVLELSLQMKHYTATLLTSYAVGHEFYKMGDRQPTSIAGRIAAEVPHAVISSQGSGVLQKWIDDAQVPLKLEGKPFLAAKEKNVDRKKLFTFLRAAAAAQPPRAVAAVASDSKQAFVVALVNGAKKITDMPDRCLIGSEDELQKALAPVLFAFTTKAPHVKLEMTTSIVGQNDASCFVDSET